MDVFDLNDPKDPSVPNTWMENLARIVFQPFLILLRAKRFANLQNVAKKAPKIGG